MDDLPAVNKFFDYAPQKLILWMRDTYGDCGVKGANFRFNCYINIVLYYERFQAWPSIEVSKIIIERVKKV